ncbi:MAG: porin family protein [Bacteroidales bacterium]
MKEDKFNDIFRNKLYDHKLPVPEEIWSKLEERLEPAPYRIVPLFKRYRSIAAIAASVIIIGSISLYLTRQLDRMEQPLVETSDPALNPVTTPVERITEQLGGYTQVATIGTASTKPTARNSVTRNIPKSIASSVHEELFAPTEPEAVTPSDQGKASVSDIARERTSEISEEEKTAKTLAFLQDGEKARNSTDWTGTRASGKERSEKMELGINFGNSGFNNSLEKQPYATLRTKINKEMVEFAQEMHPHSMGSRTNVKHHAPLIFGISVSKELKWNLAIESGVRYTYMHSELKNPEETRKESQQLHYLGIPVAVKYNFWKWKNFNAYAKAGGAIDFNLAGTWKEVYNYQADFGTGQVSAFTEEIEKRPQFSVGGSLGIAYSLSNLFQIYFEPGASYYFDNYSGVRNIRKEKPLDLSLQLGGRFTF